jgi:hypothetical protein
LNRNAWDADPLGPLDPFDPAAYSSSADPVRLAQLMSGAQLTSGGGRRGEQGGGVVVATTARGGSAHDRGGHRGGSVHGGEAAKVLRARPSGLQKPPVWKKETTSFCRRGHGAVKKSSLDPSSDSSIPAFPPPSEPGIAAPAVSPLDAAVGAWTILTIFETH